MALDVSAGSSSDLVELGGASRSRVPGLALRQCESHLLGANRRRDHGKREVREKEKKGGRVWWHASFKGHVHPCIWETITPLPVWERCGIEGPIMLSATALHTTSLGVGTKSGRAPGLRTGELPPFGTRRTLHGALAAETLKWKSLFKYNRKKKHESLCLVRPHSTPDRSRMKKTQKKVW